MEKSITTRLNEELLEKLDALITRGIFTDRDDAIQKLLEQQLKHVSDSLQRDDRGKRLETKSKLSNEELIELGKTLFSDSSVEELIKHEIEHDSYEKIALFQGTLQLATRQGPHEVMAKPDGGPGPGS